MSLPATTLLLVRTHLFDERLCARLARLARESGYKVVCVVDESLAPLDCRGWPKLRVDREVCQAMGLYCPDDFAWRCGDYCLYIARQAHPEISHFWMLEYDVGMQFGDLAEFFSQFAAFEDIDFIAPYLSRRFRNWYWHQSVVRRYPAVYGCLFPIVRVSGRSVDHLLAARRAASERWRCDREWHAAGEWPNDEAFVACELVDHGFRCRDLNSFGHRLYSKRTFTFDAPIAAGDLDRQEPDGMIYHPVLHGSTFERKLRRFEAEQSRIRTHRAKHFLWSLKWAGIQALFAYGDRRFWR